GVDPLRVLSEGRPRAVKDKPRESQGFRRLSMDQTAAPAPQILVESLLAFWADAGVDCLYQDEAIDRVATGLILPPRRVEAPAAAAARPAAGEGSANIAQGQTGDAIALARRLATEAKDLNELAAAIS